MNPVADCSSECDIGNVELMTLFDPPYTQSKQVQIMELVCQTARKCERKIEEWKGTWECYDDMTRRHPKYMKDIIPSMTEQLKKQTCDVITAMKMFREDLELLHEANGGSPKQQRKRLRSGKGARGACSKMSY